MAREHADWGRLTRSIRGNRAGRATFYKPVCVIAAIDLADIGRLDSDLLHSDLIMRRFGEYVDVAFSDRAAEGWQPLWNLAKDGLWTFSKKGKRLTREDLRAFPSTKNKAQERYDTQSIASEYRTIWESAAQRKVLRDQMLLILARDSENRRLVRALLQPGDFDHEDRWPDEATADRYLQDIIGQGDLFHAASESEAMSGGGVRAGGARTALLSFDLARLPTASAVGPTFEATGDAPIRLAPLPTPQYVGLAQAELKLALTVKCKTLEGLASASNRAAHIMPALVALTAALADPGQASSYLIWSHANTLRQLHDAERLAVESADPEHPPLPDRLRVLLGDVVEQFNAYALTDHVIGLLDRARLGPGSRSRSLESLQAGTGLVAAIRAAPGILEPEATEVLETATKAAQDAKGAPSFNADQAVANAVEIQRNGARAILVNALIEVKKVLSDTKSIAKIFTEGATKQLGAEAIKLLPISSFVAGTRDLFATLWHGIAGSDAVHQLVTNIRELISQLRG